MLHWTTVTVKRYINASYCHYYYLFIPWGVVQLICSMCAVMEMHNDNISLLEMQIFC